MVFKPKGVDIHVESRARDQARWLIRDHGDDAEDVLRAKIHRENASDADRYRYKLTLREIGRLRRSDPQKYGPGKQQGLLGSILGIFS
jgi:hypothetical protein